MPSSNTDEDVDDEREEEEEQPELLRTRQHDLKGSKCALTAEIAKLAENLQLCVLGVLGG